MSWLGNAWNTVANFKDSDPNSSSLADTWRDPLGSLKKSVNAVTNQFGLSSPGTPQSTNPEYDAFVASLKGPVDPNSPYAKFVLRGATSAANRDAASRGIQGGLSGRNTLDSWNNAYAGLDMQRQQMYAQAMGQQNANRYQDQGRQDQIQAQKRAQLMQMINAPMQVGGAALGGLGAIAAGVPQYAGQAATFGANAGGMWANTAPVPFNYNGA